MNWRGSQLLPQVFAALAYCCAACTGTAAVPRTPDELFVPGQAHVIHIKLSPERWDLLQPGVGAGKATPGATREQGRAAGVRLRPTSPTFAYVLTEVEFNGYKVPDVGLRLKGNSSYSVSASTLRRPMRLDFNRFVKGGRFAGVETLNLSNTTFDPSHLRESLAFWLFQELEVPAPRTGHALVYLTVTGRHEKEYLGLYTLIEEVDEHFLKRHFGRSDGLLLKPSGMRGFAYLGETWDQYRAICSPRGNETPETCQKVIEFAKLINRADDAAFRAGIASVLDVEEFLRYVAATSAIINFDSFLSTGHNYYVYVHPKDGRLHFIPWDVNMSFGSYGWLGTDEELARTSITRSYADHNILTERLLGIEEYARAYKGHMRRLAATAFNSNAMRQRRQLLQPALEAASIAASRAGNTNNIASASGMGLNPPDLWSFVEKRAESIQLQLDGKQAGFKPEFSNPRRTLAEWAPLTVAAVTFMTANDTDHDWRLSDLEITNAVHRLFVRANIPTNGSIDPSATLATIEKIIPENLSRRVPAKVWADWLFTIADDNKDKQITPQELFTTYRRHQLGSDPDRDGRMDNRELLEALSGAGAPRDPEPSR